MSADQRNTVRAAPYEEVPMTRDSDGTDPFLTAALPPGSLPFPRQPLPPLPPKWSALAADAPAEGLWRDFDQAKIRCTMTVCSDGLHCYKLTRKLAEVIGPGTCRECRQPLVSLERTGQRDLADVDHTFAALQTEAIRHYFWHTPFGEKALGYALRAGRVALHERVAGRIRSRIGAAQPFRDGTQTPISSARADAIDFALHAIAACCRTCASYWHGLPKGRPLTETEIAYLSELARRYLDARLPSLPDEGQRIRSPRRTGSGSRGGNVRPLAVLPAPAAQRHAS
jgi:hypothetical protein